MTIPARISIVTLGVRDVARSVAFYERALARLDGRWAGTGKIECGLHVQ